MNKELFCNIHGLDFKSLEDNMVIGGFIATTHLDDGWYDENSVLVKDKISKEALDVWAGYLNDGNPKVNKVSINHDRNDKIVAGVGEAGTAKVIELPDGEFGLYVDTIIDATHPQFPNIKNRIDIGTVDSFSIEFEAGPSSKINDSGEGYNVRDLNADTMLYGYTLASRPMNENAIMIKEIMKTLDKSDVQKKQEVNKMTEKIEVKEGDSEETPKVEPTLEPEVEPTVEEPKSEPEPKEVTKMTESKEVKFSEDDLKILKEAKESMVKQAQKKEREDMLKEITEDLKKSFGFAKVENKVMFAKDVEVKELVEYKEALQNKDVSIDRQFKVAGKLAEKLGLFESDMKDKGIITDRRHKEFICNGTKLEMKGLGVTTNQNTDTDYLLSGAELHDVMDPVIYNALNEATVFWNVLSKEDFSMKGNNQVQWVSKYSANSTAGAYLGNSVDTSNTSRLKVQTKFKKYQAGVMVDGDMIAAARGGPFGDIFTVEVRDATETLLSKINIALFAEVGLETVAGIIGLEYIADSAGNTTMYNLTRSSYSDWLAPATAGDTYINGSSADISLANMRSLKRNAFKRGSQVKDLIYVTDHIQGDKIRGIYDASQRNVPTISRWGFEGMLSFDGIPIFEDKDCNDDDMFLVDLKHHKVAIWVPPTLEMLGKDSDSIKGFIKTYFAVYNTLPCTVGMIYANATT